MAAVGCLLPHGSNETARSLRDGLAAAGLPWGAVAAVSALLASAAVGMLLRWRWPLFAVALLTWCVGQAWPVMCVASYTAATAYRRSLHMTVHTVAATMALALPDLAAMACHRQRPGWSRVLLGTLAGAALFVWLPLSIGLWIGARRDVHKGLRQRAEHQERERAARVEEARAQERARIARDVHDIVAHQVSLMVLHAGALEVNARDEATASGAAVTRALARGLSNAEIGRALRLTETTVKAHISGSLTKLNLTNRVQLAVLVHGAGLADEGAPGDGLTGRTGGVRGRQRDSWPARERCGQRARACSWERIRASVGRPWSAPWARRSGSAGSGATAATSSRTRVSGGSSRPEDDRSAMRRPCSTTCEASAVSSGIAPGWVRGSSMDSPIR
ncbi:hypothetical protein FGK60_28110 [Streptomyces sp. DASNCL29]|nr:hypothetical protein FGK60_28110 [Streptomyces sp. DASNCL29]